MFVLLSPYTEFGVNMLVWDGATQAQRLQTIWWPFGLLDDGLHRFFSLPLFNRWSKIENIQERLYDADESSVTLQSAKHSANRYQSVLQHKQLKADSLNVIR